MFSATRHPFLLRLCLLFAVPGQESQENFRETKLERQRHLELQLLFVLVFDVFQGLVDQVMQQLYLGRAQGHQYTYIHVYQGELCNLHTHTFLL